MIDVRSVGGRRATRFVREDAARLLRHLALEADLSVVLCDDAFIRALNVRWRGKDEATDVLSFPMGDAVLGDVVISAETAARDGTPIRVLLVHGVCHLLGHDHEDECDAVRMRAKERELLGVLGDAGEGLVARATLPASS